LDEPDTDVRRAARTAWVKLIDHVHEGDPLKCINGDQAMRIVALIHGPAVIRRIVAHLKLGTPNRCSAAHLQIPRRPNHPIGPLSVNALSNTVRFPISLERCCRHTLVRSPPGGGVGGGFRLLVPSI